MTEQNPPEMNEMPADEVVEKTIAAEMEETANELAKKNRNHASEPHDEGAIRLVIRDVTEGDEPETSFIANQDYTLPWSRNINGIIEHSPADRVVIAEWTFTERMGQASTQTAKSGRFTLYPTTKVTGGDLVRFYAPNRLPRTIQVMATIQRGTTVRDDFFDLRLTPTFPDTRSSAGRVGTANIHVVGEKKYIQLGNTFTTRLPDYGFTITFGATITTAPNRGQIGIMQFMRGFTRYDKANGQMVDATTGGQWYLDKFIDNPALTYGRDGARALNVGPEITISMNDSPYMEIVNNLNKITFDQTFRTFLVYKDEKPDSRWAPLMAIQWSWRGELERDTMAGRDVWPTTFRTPPVVTKGTAVPTDDLPEWFGETGDLVAKIKRETTATLGLMPIEWPRPAQASKQMVITTVAPKTPQQVAAIENAVHCAASKKSYGGNVVLVWTSPEMAAEAKKVPGVVKVEELGIGARYFPRPDKVPPQKDYIIYLAPYFLYNETEAEMEFAMANAPKSLPEVAQDLLNICSARGIHATANVRSFSCLNFNFPNVITDDEVLRALAAHPQVNYVQRLSEHFTDDDPKNPIS